MKTDRELLMDVFLEEGVPLKLRKRIAKHLGTTASVTSVSPVTSFTTQAPIQKSLSMPIQAPSTQKLMEAQEASIAAAAGSGLLPAPVILPPKPIVPVAARIVGGSVNNGDGTSGKRKW